MEKEGKACMEHAWKPTLRKSSPLLWKDIPSCLNLLSSDIATVLVPGCVVWLDTEVFRVDRPRGKILDAPADSAMCLGDHTGLCTGWAQGAAQDHTIGYVPGSLNYDLPHHELLREWMDPECLCMFACAQLCVVWCPCVVVVTFTMRFVAEWAGG